MAHMMAVESDLVTADVVEVSEYPHIAQRYQVYAVPKVVFNESVSFEGNRPEAAFIGAIEAVTQKEDNG
jgi:predicted DsbA family dithiol-disulfide isomerase